MRNLKIKVRNNKEHDFMKTISELSASIEFSMSQLKDTRSIITFRKLFDRQFDLYWNQPTKLNKALTFIAGSLENEIAEYILKNHH